MKRIKEVFGDNLEACDIKKKGKCLIVTINGKRYVIKEKSDNDIRDYLLSRNFDYFPKIVISSDRYNVYEYIDEVDNPIEQKAYDMINVIGLLHNKTTYYKEMDINEYKEIFEKISFEIYERSNYYNNLINIIETRMFMSPSEYLIARNISKILGALEYAKNGINEWYDLVKLKARKRVVTLYNNIDLNHIIRNKDTYLISIDNMTTGIPVFDLYNFYDKYSRIVDFKELIKNYENRYPLLEEEKKLFNVLISIPGEIKFTNNEIDNCKNVKRIVDNLYKSEILVFDENM